jgi:hypothetical protein
VSDHDRSEPGGMTSPATMSDLEELALSRASALGKPVVVAAFASSGSAVVLDLDLPDGCTSIEEGELVEAARDVRIWPSRPPRPSG